MRSLLAPLPGVIALIPLPSKEEGVCTFRLEAAEGTDLRRSARLSGRSCLCWSCRDAMTLERIFLELTSDDVPQVETLAEPARKNSPDGAAYGEEAEEK